MNSINDFSSRAELARAVYANIQLGPLTPEQLSYAVIPDPFAIAFATRYTVESSHNDPLTGANAAVFRDPATGARTLVIQGTEV